MSTAQRLVLLLLAVILLGGGFMLARGSKGGNDDATAPATTPTAAQPAPAVTTIRVGGGKPVGGVQTITAHKGDRVRIAVTSPDTTSEVHFHGYDIKRDLKAGGTVRFSFVATAEGIFEMELEQTSVQIAKIVIEP